MIPATNKIRGGEKRLFWPSGEVLFFGMGFSMGIINLVFFPFEVYLYLCIFLERMRFISVLTRRLVRLFNF